MRKRTPVVVRTDGLAEYTSLRSAARKLGKTYWQVRDYVLLHRVPCLKLGTSYLVRMRDLRGLREE